MIFNQSYYTAMDRNYYKFSPPSQAPAETGEGRLDLTAPEIGLSQKDIGVSAPPFGDQLQGLKAKIFQGASKVELGFMGRGKGSMQGGNTTPEMFGKDERIDIRELAKINKIQLTTHATPNAGSLAGFQQDRFDESIRENTLHEIERAIDFAADTTNGGAVVVHAQEYQRGIYDLYGQKGPYQFEAYPEEKEKEVRYVVDDRTGQITPIRKNVIIHEPKYLDDPQDPEHYWQAVDGTKISKTETQPEVLIKRKPDWDARNFRFNTEEHDWTYFQQKADQLNRNITDSDQKVTAEEMYFRAQIENQVLRARGQSLFYATQLKDAEESYNAAKQALTFYEELEKRVPQEQLWKMMIQDGRIANHLAGLTPPKNLLPSEFLKNQIEQEEQRLRYIYEGSAGADAQVADLYENIRRIKPIKKYAEDKTAETISRAALYAMDRERKPSQESIYGLDVRGGEPFEKPLFIAIENFFPDMHGGHPEEVREMVLKARKKLESDLVDQRKMNPDQAKKEAEARIKATWDTSHANMWRKYFKQNDGETMEQADRRFKDWYLEQAEKWKKDNIIGHIHVSDNFGWEDEHVVPGEGNAPIKEFIAKMKDKIDNKEVDVIVEPAHQDYRSMLGGWKLFGSSIYGAQMGRRDSWLEVERSYFGRTAPPYFLYGESAPDPDAWSLWSGVRLE